MGIQYSGAIMLPQGGFKVKKAIPAIPTTRVLDINFDGGTVEDAVGHQITTVENIEFADRDGGKYAIFGGTGASRFFVEDTTDLTLGSGDWSIEFDIRFGNLTQQYLICQTGTGRWIVVWTNEGMKMLSDVAAPNYINVSTGTSGWSAGTWYTTKIAREGDTITIYRDGSPLASQAFTGTVQKFAPTTFGVQNTTLTNYNFTGNMDNIKIDIG